jgi:RimJ/RimL family protein N-acetyltransferase
MPYEYVDPGDATAVARLTDLGNAAHDVDDPGEPPMLPELVALDLKYGWDLEPADCYLYRPSVGAEPVGSIRFNVPKRDNLHLATAGIVVHPDHRRQGHGSAMVDEILRLTKENGRRTLWGGCWADNTAGAAFLKKHGFTYASHDARRFQYLDQLDQDQLDQQYELARQKATDYELVRVQVPTDEDLLTQLIEVTAAINDAPMGELDFEDELFDLQRLKDFEFAAQAKGERLYRVFARHKQTGAVGGHTVMMVQPKRPTFGEQYDTAVHRDHRGHRLGILLKLAMMRWLAEVEPQIERIETWNQADNRYMIDANEAIGYRLSRIYDTYQRSLT